MARQRRSPAAVMTTEAVSSISVQPTTTNHDVSFRQILERRRIISPRVRIIVDGIPSRSYHLAPRSYHFTPESYHFAEFVSSQMVLRHDRIIWLLNRIFEMIQSTFCGADPAVRILSIRRPEAVANLFRGPSSPFSVSIPFGALLVGTLCQARAAILSQNRGFAMWREDVLFISPWKPFPIAGLLGRGRTTWAAIPSKDLHPRRTCSR